MHKPWYKIKYVYGPKKAHKVSFGFLNKDKYFKG